MSKSNKKIAAALKYDSTKGNAPELVAFGEQYSADTIIEVAKKSGVPVYENAPLANSLSNLSIGQEIPKELYDVVAQILIFVAQLDESTSRKYE